MLEIKEKPSVKIDIQVLETEKNKLESKLKQLSKDNLKKNRAIEDLNNLLSKKSHALNQNMDAGKEKSLLEGQN